MKTAQISPIINLVENIKIKEGTQKRSMIQQFELLERNTTTKTKINIIYIESIAMSNICKYVITYMKTHSVTP